MFKPALIAQILVLCSFCYPTPSIASDTVEMIAKAWNATAAKSIDDDLQMGLRGRLVWPRHSQVKFDDDGSPMRSGRYPSKTVTAKLLMDVKINIDSHAWVTCETIPQLVQGTDEVKLYPSVKCFDGDAATLYSPYTGTNGTCDGNQLTVDGRPYAEYGINGDELNARPTHHWLCVAALMTRGLLVDENFKPIDFTDELAKGCLTLVPDEPSTGSDEEETLLVRWQPDLGPMSFSAGHPTEEFICNHDPPYKVVRRTMFIGDLHFLDIDATASDRNHDHFDRLTVTFFDPMFASKPEAVTMAFDGETVALDSLQTLGARVAGYRITPPQGTWVEDLRTGHRFLLQDSTSQMKWLSILLSLIVTLVLCIGVYRRWRTRSP